MPGVSAPSHRPRAGKSPPPSPPRRPCPSRPRRSTRIRAAPGAGPLPHQPSALPSPPAPAGSRGALDTIACGTRPACQRT
eukprot:8921903-Pyramimonas_sp.AAC.1